MKTLVIFCVALLVIATALLSVLFIAYNRKEETIKKLKNKLMEEFKRAERLQIQLDRYKQIAENNKPYDDCE